MQVFVTDAAIQYVFSFYGEVFAEQRWVRLSQSQSPLGATCEYASVGRVGNLPGPEHWIVVASTYIARDGEENGDPPPGFRANGISYAPRGTDKTYFSIITPKP